MLICLVMCSISERHPASRAESETLTRDGHLDLVRINQLRQLSTQLAIVISTVRAKG